MEVCVFYQKEKKPLGSLPSSQVKSPATGRGFPLELLFLSTQCKETMARRLSSQRTAVLTLLLSVFLMWFRVAKTGFELTCYQEKENRKVERHSPKQPHILAYILIFVKPIQNPCWPGVDSQGRQRIS